MVLLPFGLPADLPVGLYFFFLYLCFLFLNLSKIAFKVTGSIDESLDDSVA